MLHFNLSDFYKTIGELSRLADWVPAGNKGNSIAENGVLSEKDRAHVSRLLKALIPHLDILGIRVTRMTAHEALAICDEADAKLSEVRSAVAEVGRNAQRELKATAMLCLTERERALFTPNQPLFGEQFTKRFLDASFEIDQAAKCLALGRPTACVFHLMRTMEIGIRAIARCLGIPDPIKPSQRNWGSILRAIKEAIEKKWPAGTPSNEELHLFESLCASLDAVKNPVRNATMHVEKKYTEDQAEHVLVAVKGFMTALASRCGENGEPKVS